jgi:hypothetical protein
MNNAKKRSKKYSTTIKRYNTDKVEQGDLYYLNNKGGFSKKDRMNVKVNGIAVKTYLSLYEDLQQVKRDADLYLNTQNQALTEFLISKGLITPNVDLNALIGDLSKLLVVVPSKSYDLLQKDSNGYIVSKTEINGSIIDRPIEYPVDLLHGYTREINGKFIDDEVKKNEILSGGMF